MDEGKEMSSELIKLIVDWLEASQCVYDNPDLLRREWWTDGELEQWVTAECIDCLLYPNIDNIRKFNPGEIIGDPLAMEEKKL